MTLNFPSALFALEIKHFVLLLSLISAGCKNQVASFAAPATSDVISIQAQLYASPDGSEHIDNFEVPKSSYKAIIEALNGAGHDDKPMKWQVLGDIKIHHSTGILEVSLFLTGKERGAFSANGQYYRGSSDQNFIRLISSTHTPEPTGGH